MKKAILILLVLFILGFIKIINNTTNTEPDEIKIEITNSSSTSNEVRIRIEYTSSTEFLTLATSSF